MFLSHLLACNVHVPDDDAAVTAAGDELTGVWGVAQTLNFITVQKPHRKQDLITPNIKKKKIDFPVSCHVFRNKSR